MKSIFKDFDYYEKSQTHKLKTLEDFFIKATEYGWLIDDDNECFCAFFDIDREFNIGDIVKLNDYYAIIEHKSYDLKNNIIEYIIREE